MRVNGALVLGLLVAIPVGAVEAQSRRFRAVNAGMESSCAIAEDEIAWCWGGQASFGRSSRNPVPAPFPLLGVGFAAISIAGRTTCGLGTDSLVYCVGDDLQLGFRRGRHPRSPADHWRPARLGGGPIAGALRFRDVNAGPMAVCAVDTGGRAWCWGRNDNGQFGNGSRAGAAVPVDSPVTARITVPLVSVVVDARHGCGLTTEGAAWCWGTNEFGQLGDGTTTERMVPGPVAGDHRFRSIAVNAMVTCGVTTAGAGLCWGGNVFGTIGDGTRGIDRTVPTRVAGGHTWRLISLGAGFACGLADDGAAWCWGQGTQGSLGTGTVGEPGPASRTYVHAASPVAVVGGLRFTTLDAGYDHVCGVTVDGDVWCWGGNGVAQLGLPLFDGGVPAPQRVVFP